VPPSGLSAVESGGDAELTWTASPDTGILGYHVYRSADAGGPYTRVNAELVAGTSYTDTNPLAGDSTYMVRAVRLEQSVTGTYYNASQGIFATFSSGGPGSPPPAPVITTDGGNGAGVDYTTTSSDLVVEGTCDSSLETVEVNGSTTGVAYTSGATTWSYSGTLSEGANVFEVTGTDGQPLTSSADTITVTLDTTPPSVPVITTDGGNGAGVDYATNNPSVTLEGACSSDTWAVEVNGSPSGVSYVGGETVWSYAGALSEGLNAFSVTAQDNVGNESTADTITITLDTVPPPAPVITTDGGNGSGEDFITTSAGWILEGTCDSSTRMILVNGSFSGVAYVAGETSWSYTASLSEGSNNYSVNAQDDVGNERR